MKKNIIAILATLALSIAAHADPSRLFCVVYTTEADTQTELDEMKIIVDKTTDDGATDESVMLDALNISVTVSQGERMIVVTSLVEGLETSSAFTDMAIVSFTNGKVRQNLVCEVLNPGETPKVLEP